MLKIPAADQFGGKSDIPANDHAGATGSTAMKNTAASAAISSANRPRAQFRRRSAPFKSGEEAWARRIQSGQADQNDDQRHRRPARRACRSNISATGPTASPRASCRPASRRGRRASSATSSSRPGTGPTRRHYLHDLISHRQAQSDGQRLWPIFGSPEYSTDNFPILDPKTDTAYVFHAPVRDPDMPESLGPGHAAHGEADRALGLLGRPSRSGTRTVNNHNSMFDEQGQAVARRQRSAAGTDPAFCKKGSDLRPPRLFPLDAKRPPAGDARSEDDEIHLHRHLLHARIICNSASTRTIRCGLERRRRRRRRLARHQDVRSRPATRRSRRAGRALVLDTNGNGKRDDVPYGAQPAA